MIEGWDMPSRPDSTYAGQGWECWGEFLGNGKTPTLRRSYDEWITIAKQLVVEHGGTLPKRSVVRGLHPGLTSAIRRRPDLFRDIPRTWSR